MTDFVNGYLPGNEEFNFTANGTSSFSLLTLETKKGLDLIFTLINFTDGDYTIEVLDSNDGGSTGVPITSGQLITPSLLIENSLSPFLVNAASSLAYFGLRDLQGDAIKVNITAANVTVGSDLHVMLLSHPTRTPVTNNQVV